MNGIVVLNLYHVWHLDLSKPKTISGEPYATLGPTKCAGDHNRYTAYYIYTCIYTSRVFDKGSHPTRGIMLEYV